MTQNQIAYWSMREGERSNLAREKEEHRSNVAREKELLRSNLAREQETNRSNMAREKETNRANLASELNAMLARQQQFTLSTRSQDEVNRSNRANEALGYARIAQEQQRLAAQVEQFNRQLEQTKVRDSIQLMNAIETQRSHKAEELLRSDTLAEQVRASKAREQLQNSTLSETIRSNQMREGQDQQRIFLQGKTLDENRRHAIASEKETVRHNTTMETLKGLEIAVPAVQRALSGGMGSRLLYSARYGLARLSQFIGG